MKVIFIFDFKVRVALVLGLCAALCACEAPSAPVPSSGDAETVRRLAAILDYVAADYPATVSEGRIVSLYLMTIHRRQR